MYNNLLNYFENNCCLANIYMKNNFIEFYLTMIGSFVVWTSTNIIFSGIRGIVIGSILLLAILISFFIDFANKSFKEIKEEMNIKKITINWLTILTGEKSNSVCYEFQCKRLTNYCKENKIVKEDLITMQKYVDEDLKNKYPKDKTFQNFFITIVPFIVSIATVYLTNNDIKNLEEIISVALFYVFLAFIVSYVIYAIKDIRYVFVNPRRNLLELKDVLRNIE